MGLSLSAQSIPDSRGAPTICVTLADADGHTVTASAPSGKSAGSREAFVRRDPDGGVTEAIRGIVEELAPLVADVSPSQVDGPAFDRMLLACDGTKEKSRLGANAILPVSIAYRRIRAGTKGVPLWRELADEAGTDPAFPALFVNMMNGGAHAGFGIPFQETMGLFSGLPSETVPRVERVYAKVGTRVEAEYGSVPLGDEGGYALKEDDVTRPLALLADAIKGEEGVALAIDAAASELFHDDAYMLGPVEYSREGLAALYVHLAQTYPLVSIEDPFDEDDDDGFRMLVALLPASVRVVGDDLTTTNPQSIVRAQAERLATGVIIKPNQIGTVSEAIAAAQLAREAGWSVIVSHRSGETDDDFIADLAYAIGATGLKAGAPSQAVRRAKYDRLRAIEEESASIRP